jgi:para-nitrobenzyl esterase
MYRIFLAVTLLLLLLAGCGREAPRQPQMAADEVGSSAVWSNNPAVKMPSGAVLGHEGEYETWAWKGIPFAQPPVGELRWKAPRKAQPWEGTLVAEEYGNKCPQISPIPVIGGMGGHEDCLTLNVIRPKTDEKNLPVFVWIHGGGNAAGEAGQYPGDHLASQANLVYVSLQYRLGALGWATHPALRGGESPSDDSGNYGTLDLIEGLTWVRENIEAFGGNPANITVGGTSAGAINTLSLYLSEPASEVFDAGFMVSPIPSVNDVDDGIEAMNRLIRKLLVADGDSDDDESASQALQGMSMASIREYLYGKTDEEILEAAKGNSLAEMWPTVFADGHVLVKHGMQAFVRGDYPNKKPILMGNSKEEMKFFMQWDRSMDWETPQYQLLGEYSGYHWKETVDSVADFVVSHEDAPPVYVYRYDWGAPNADGHSVFGEELGIRIGAMHAMAPQLFLGLAKTGEKMMRKELYTEENEPGREQLVKTLMGYIENFSASHNPNTGNASGLPQWKPWDANRETLVVDASETELQVRMERIETTGDSWLADMKQKLDPEVFSTVSELAPNYAFAEPLKEEK